MTHRYADQAHADRWACPKTGTADGAGGAYTDQCSLPRNPVESAALPLRETVIRNEVTASPLSVVVDTRSRCQPEATRGGMAEEANALGKAEGYADVGPAIRMVGPLVGVDRS